MINKDDLKKLIGKKCWFSGGILEIRKKSDAEIISVNDTNLVLKHFLGKVNYIPISQIQKVIVKEN